MENLSNMTAEFTANIKESIKQLADLFKAYDLAKLGYQMQYEREKDCYNEALATTPFYAAKSCNRCSVKEGERVTNEFYSFLLSEDDFNRLLSLAEPILEREGITDANGYYREDWLTIRGNARRALVDFIIDTVLPESMKPQFSAVRLNIVQTDKLLDIVRPIVVP